MAQSQFTAISTSQIQVILLPQPPEYCRVPQAGLELLTSGDPPTLASQSAGITDRPEPLCWASAEIYIKLENGFSLS